MPTWNQIQAQLRHPNNPVVFFDVSVGTTVSFFLNINNAFRLKPEKTEYIVCGFFFNRKLVE